MTFFSVNYYLMKVTLDSCDLTIFFMLHSHTNNVVWKKTNLDNPCAKNC